MLRFPGERHVAPLGPPKNPIRVINRGACWNTQGVSRAYYLRASATDHELSNMRYPAQGFRTFRSVREVKP